MPVTIQHVLTATTPDNTSAEIRPSHWNSAHAITLSLAGSEVIKFVGAAGSSISSGTLSFSNSNGVSFGMNGGTITASHNGITSQTVQTQGVQSISAGGTRVTGGELVFSNSNGLAFGINGQTLTGSYTVPTQTAQSMGVYASSQTTGASSSSTVDARSLSIVGAGGVSVGLTGGSVVISGAAGGGGANSFNILAAGTQTAGTATTVGFANSNGITFGMSGSAQITASHNALTSQSNQAISAANGSSAFQTLSFGDSNGVSWSLSNGSVVASVAGVNSASVYAGSNTTNASSSVLALSSFLVAGAGNISAGFSNGSLVISGASGAAQTITQYATGNTAGDASTGAQALSSIVVRGAGIASVGYSNDGALIVSVPAGGGGGDGANFIAAGTQTATTLGTVGFVNSNGITFGMSGSTQVTASHNGLTSQSNQALSAANGSFAFQTASFSNANGVSWSTSAGSAIVASVAAQSAQTIGIYGSSQTTGQSSSSTVDARSVTYRGAGIVSVGLSAGEVIISATGGAGGAAISAAGSSQNAGTIVFSNSNGMSFGMNGSTVTGSHNGLTTAAASNHSHGNPTLALTNLTGTTASASNGFTLSLSAAAAGGANSGTFYALGNSTVNSSGTLPMSAVSMRAYGVMSVGTSNGSLLLSTPDAVEFTQLSVGMSTQGNTAGDTGLFTGRVVFVGSNNVTLSGSSNGGSATISIVAAGGGGGTGPSIAAGTQTASTGTVVFSNSNNVTFGLSGSTRLTASVGVGLYAVGNTTQASSTQRDVSAISFNAIGGATMGFSNGSVQVSVPAASLLSATGAVSLSTNGSTVSIGVPNLSIYASSNTTAQSSSSSVALGSLTVRGVGGVSVGMSAGELVISGGAGAAVTASAANGSYTVGNLSFSNANGVSFGTSAGSAITASVAAQTNQTLGLYATGNTTQNSSTTFDARTLGTMNGLGAMTVGFSNGSIQLSAPATSSLSATGQVSISTNGSTISIGVPNPTTDTNGYNPYADQQLQINQIGQASLIFDPQSFPNIAFDRLLIPISNVNSSNSSGSHTLSFWFGLYSRNVSTLSLVGSTSGSTAVTHSGTQGSYSLFSGLRHITIGTTATVTAGKYWMAFVSRTTSGGANGSYSNLMVNNGYYSNSAASATFSYAGRFGVANNATDQMTLGQGFYTATTSGIPSSVAFSQINGTAQNAGNQQALLFASSTV